MKFFRGENSWNSSYKDGSWDYLSKDISEIARQGLVATLISVLDQQNGAKTSVLDLGCGEGVLYKYLGDRYSYTGVDVSSEAIKRARIAHPKVSFQVADIGSNAFSIKPQSYDFIVLNEVLYYLNAKEYATLCEFLIKTCDRNKETYIIASICRTDKQIIHHSSYYWSTLFENFAHQYSTEIGDLRHKWDIKVFSRF